MILRQIYQRFCNHQRTKEELLKTWIVKEESHSSQRFPQPLLETNYMTHITPSILAGKALAILNDLEPSNNFTPTSFMFYHFTKGSKLLKLRVSSILMFKVPHNAINKCS